MGDIPKFDQLSNVPLPITGTLMSREKFADMIGIPVGVVTGWCDRGYLPVVPIGKYSLINVALLHQQCLNRAFK
ncbi:hypothetical protein ACO0LF_29795 [Undibacterium sp. Di27W]|uniref:hypothetical protein n=1 Tax=Undibacterium sp. Di27W TaxID=3413036 RepID=UPI003BF06CB6